MVLMDMCNGLKDFNFNFITSCIYSFVLLAMRVVNVTSIVNTQLQLEFLRVDKEVINRTRTFKLVEISMLLFILIVALLLKRIIFSFLLKQQRSFKCEGKP